MRTSRRRARRSRARSTCLPEPDFDGIVRRAQAEQRAPSISAAVFRGRELLWSGAVGLADVEAGRGATPETRYPIASITKSFGAVSVLQLRDAGELALDDPIASHVPDAPAGPTILTLLSHLSGIQREVPGSGWETLVFPSRDEPPEVARGAIVAAGGLWSTTGDIASYGAFLHEPVPQVPATLPVEARR